MQARVKGRPSNGACLKDLKGKLHPYGVDVSSGIERDGVKDQELMKLFVENVRKEQL